MNNLVAKILEIKVLESPSVQIHKTEFDLKSLTEQVIAGLKIQTDNKRIRINTEIAEANVKTDSSLLIQILDNLISNAVKFSNPHSQVWVRLIEIEEVIRFEIEDEGPGINEEDKPHLFKKFQKLTARPTDGESSTGLGLSIVKKYVEALEGRVWCESEAGHGAKFIVELQQ